jgi:aryl-alcohol dehydrogenase-like predicted oxidoreductase
MVHDFLHATFGRTGIPVFRLGLSATYRPGRAVIHQALDAGVNFFFCYGFDGQMIKTLRELSARQRERYVVATGAYNLLVGHFDLRRTLEKRLRQLRTDYLDVYLYLGVMKPAHFPRALRDQMAQLRAEGKVRAIGMSCHDRQFVGALAEEGVLDALMVRYNPAHPGAEQDIFPHLATHQPGVISYTATRWRRMLRRPKGWTGGERVPTAGDCYRFVLGSPHVDVCLTAPSNAQQFAENLKAVQAGPLATEDAAYLRSFGAAVRATAGWFM